MARLRSEEAIVRGKSEQERRLSETERQINDQYRFSILYKVLDDSGSIKDLDTRAEEDEPLSVEQGNVIKISGDCTTDPFYRLLSAVSLMLRIFEAEEVAEEMEENPSETFESKGMSIFDQWKGILHGENIGLKLDSDDFGRPVVMAVNIENLWVNPQREFLSSHDYTVVGRVDRVMAGSEKWDFIDILQIIDSVFSDESVDAFRDSFAEVAENIGEIGEDDNEAEFAADISSDDYVVEEPAIVIDPVAIYW